MVDGARKPVRLDRAELVSRRVRARNWAIFAILAGLVLLFYAMTIVRMGGAAQ